MPCLFANKLIWYSVMCVFILITVVRTRGDEHSALRSERKNRLLLRHPRSASTSTSADAFGTAVFFKGHEEVIKRQLGDEKIFSKDEFSMQFWIKPEGGQSRFTPIIDINDECNMTTNGWTVGIQLPSYSRQDARFIFSFQSDHSLSDATLVAHKGYERNIWTNIAVTHDRKSTKLYINGAEVSSSKEHSIKSLIAHLKCPVVVVGGRPDEELFFRGRLDELGIWKRALSHSEVVDNINKASDLFLASNDIIIAESFSSLTRWEIDSDDDRLLVLSDIVLPYHTVRLEAPTCGKTICDDPEVVMSYLNHPYLRTAKKVNYRVVNIYDDDGRFPIVSEKQIVQQHSELNKAFEPYGISFELDILRMKDTVLLRKVFMFDCHPFQVGDGNCDSDCAHSTTGNDGGDCDHVISECKSVLLGNGQCNAECNKVYHNYDNGDCCQKDKEYSYRTCVDPTSPQRGYMHIDELKLQLQVDGRAAFNVFFITSSWNSETFRGLATYPWEKNIYSSMGGVVMHADVFGRQNHTTALVHEFGHMLGLWHVHRGVSEMACDNPCLETHPSMVLGDLCSDTNPSPRNTHCRDPSKANLDSETCGLKNFINTPYRNYMSYADGGCVDSFTPQQEARMHCYLDLVYQSMTVYKQSPPVPVAPRVIQSGKDYVHVVWLQPLGLDGGCDTEQALYQYASTATASHIGLRWAPSEATGFPDADACSPSRYAWKPYHSSSHPGCDFDVCWIELEFLEPVIPARISIWVVDIRDDTDLYVEMIAVTGEVIPVGDVPAYCDMETTVLVDTDKLINKIKIHTVDSYIAIDAVEMVSRPGFTACARRPAQKYVIERDPPFSDGFITTSDNQLKDMSVKVDVTYTYTVQTSVGSSLSVKSPALVYTHGQPFCGDGLINSGEECDDSNAVDGDGCSLECKIEEGFICIDSPSLCSISMVRACDPTRQVCGLEPPDGFQDQWPVDASANPEYQTAECPVSLLTGKPEKIQKCVSRPVGDFWRPCGELWDISGDFWIQVYFYKPVVATSVILHLASDGRSLYDQDVKVIHAELIYTDESRGSITGSGAPVKCEKNPLQLPVIQDLSKPFRLTKGVRLSFSSSSIGLYAVRVRSSPHINPPGISSCSESELYSVRHGVCISDKCTKKACEEFLVKYGEAVCSGLEDGDSCKIQCNRGYIVGAHENRAVCVDGSWISTSPLFCSPVDCGKPVVPMATFACPDGTTYSKKCHFKCNKPASLIGDDASLVCLRNGRWSKPLAACEIQCEPLDAIAYDNGKLKTTSCIKGPQPVGQQCKVRCQEGYHVEDERMKRRYLRIVCDDDGEWFGPKCIPNTCPPLPTKFTGAFTCTRGFESGSTCTIKCQDDLTKFPSVTCSKNGQWDGELQLCPRDKLKTCAPPTSGTHVRLECDSTKPGGTCAVTCTDEKQKPVSKSKGSDRESGDMQSYVERIECTVLQKWEPNPQRITCVKPCDEMAQGDGFCDGLNNRDICDWDGGDCCASTVLGGAVIPMDEECTTDCGCKDPLAVENRRRLKRHKHDYWTG